MLSRVGEQNIALPRDDLAFRGHISRIAQESESDNLLMIDIPERCMSIMWGDQDIFEWLRRHPSWLQLFRKA